MPRLSPASLSAFAHARAQPIWMLGGRPLPEFDEARFAFEQSSTDEPTCASCGQALCSHDDWRWRCPPGLLPTMHAIAAGDAPVPAHAFEVADA